MRAKVQAGQVILLSDGRYSDYSVSGILRAIVDVDMNEMLRKWLMENPDKADLPYFDVAEYVSYLFKCGAFEPIEYEEYGMGDYGALPSWYERGTECK